ncbi:MAG: molybdopterin-dependent oxidoreductase [Sedimentibacter sp.]
MNKRLLIVISIIIILLASVIFSLKLNGPSIEMQKEMLANAEILLKYDDTQIILNKENITMGEEENFDAVLDTSDTNPVVHSYSGVQLKNILYSNNINIENSTAVILSAADGYSVAYSIDEVLRDNNIYVAYMEDGQYLGSKDEGGRGPYESIIVSDSFSNRRCKWLTKIEVK